MAHLSLSLWRKAPEQYLLVPLFLFLRRVHFAPKNRCGAWLQRVLLLAAGMLIVSAAQAQTLGKIHLRLEKTLTGKFVYWFTAGGHSPSDQAPLPTANAKGVVLLNIPDGYVQPDAQLVILNMLEGKIAHIPIKLPPAPATPPDGGPDLLQNGDFTNGADSWREEINSATVSAAREPVDNETPPPGVPGKVGRYNVKAIDEADWHFQVSQSGLDLQEGAYYTLSFWARADRARPLSLYASVDEQDYHHIGLEEQMNLTTEWHRYRFTFKAVQTLQNSNRITFVLGGALGKVDFADVALRQRAAEMLGDNVLQNGDFAHGMEGWYPLFLGDSAKASQEIAFAVTLPSGVSKKAAHIQVTTAGHNPWSVKLTHNTMDLTERGAYTLAFWARADRERPLLVTMEVDQGDYHSVGLAAPLTLTPNWHLFTLPFTATQTLPQHNNLIFHCGQAVGAVDVADVALRPIQDAKPLPVTVVIDKKLDTGDFHYAPLAKVLVKYRGKPVQEMEVSLQWGDKIVGPYRIQPTDRGIAHFDQAPTGAKLDVKVTYGKQSAEYFRTVLPDASADLEEIDLPDTWKNVLTDDMPVHPLIGVWESQPDRHSLVYRFTFNPDGTGSIRRRSAVSTAAASSQPTSTGFQWSLKDDGQHVVIGAKLYTWSVSLAGKDENLILVDQKRNTHLLYRH